MSNAAMRLSRSLAPGLLALVAAPLARAAEEAAGHAEAPPNPANFQVAPFFASLILFGVVLFILGKYAWPKLIQALQEREEKIRREIEDAERARQQAQSALEQYEQALSQARAEAQKMLDEAKAQQQTLAAQMRAQTEQELNQLRDRARREIDAAKEAAVAEIYSQMASTATEIASRILQREISPDDQRRLVEESLQQLHSTAGA